MTPRVRTDQAWQALYNTPMWVKSRRAFLDDPQHAVCACCGQHLSTVVDHIHPHRGDLVLFWERSNWQGVCKVCHDWKTAVEQSLARWRKEVGSDQQPLADS